MALKLYVAVALFLCGLFTSRTRVQGVVCPRNCSGHGTCDITYKTCSCDSPYNASSDCSRKSCPYGVSWAAKPRLSTLTTIATTPHNYQECSGRGLCNRELGQCSCFTGFEGQSCQRASCACDNGVCMTTSALYYIKNRALNSTSYTAWDASSTTACLCDYGFTGPSCSMRLCPKGFDPLISTSNYRTFNITVSASSGYLSGYFRLILNQDSILFPANGYDWSASECESAIETFPEISYALCTQGTVESNGATTYTIQFTKYSTLPHENNIFTLSEGDVPYSSLDCISYSADGADDIACSIESLTYSDIPEYDFCSKRGVCDFNTGECACYSDFLGSACSVYYSPAADVTSSDSMDVLVLANDDTSYTFKGSVLYLNSNTSASTDFDFIKITNTYDDSNVTLLAINGNGDTTISSGGLQVLGLDGVSGQTIRHGGLYIASGMTVGGGGLTVESHGMTVGSEGLRMLGGGQDIAISGGLSVITGGLYVQRGVTVSSGLVKAESGGLTAARGLSVSSAGVVVQAGGIVITRGGLAVNGGVSITSRGAIINNAGLSVYSGGLVVSGGLTQGSIAYLSGGVTVSSIGAAVASGVTVTSGGFTGSSVSVSTGGVYIAGGVVAQGALLATGGLTVQASGVTVVTGDIDIQSGSATIASGLVVASSMTIIGGAVVAASGLSVSSTSTNFIQGGLLASGNYVNGGGLTISTGSPSYIDRGITVSQGGLRISGGVTLSGLHSVPEVIISKSVSVLSGGLRVSTLIGQSGGLVVQSGGATLAATLGVAGGFSVLSGGVVSQSFSCDDSDVTGGITILSTGLSGVSVSASAMAMTGGLSIAGTLSGVTDITVLSRGLTLDGDFTISDYGFFLSPQGLYTSGGLTVSDGLYMSDATVIGERLSVTQGLSVASNVVVQAGGLSVYSGGITVTSPSAANEFTSELLVAGGITNSGGIVTSGGITIESSGLNVLSGSATLSGGVVVLTNGATVQGLLAAPLTAMTISGNFGAIVRGPSVIVSSGGAVVRRGNMVSSSLQVTGGLSVVASGLVISGGLTVTGSDLAVYGGLTLSGTTGVSAGTYVSVQSGGAAVGSNAYFGGGLLVTGGVTLSSGHFTASDSMSVLSGGLAIEAGGMTIESGGLTVQSGTVQAAYLTASSAVLSGGLTVAGDAMSSSGVSVDGGVRVDGLGVSVEGGVSILSSGLAVSNGLTVSGPAYISGGVAVFSDLRLKDNVVEAVESLAKVRKLRGVYFNWKDGARGFDANRKTGFLAQDVEKVLPEVVSGIGTCTSNPCMGVRYSEILPLLLQATKELHSRVLQLPKHSQIYLDEQDCSSALSRARAIKSDYEAILSQAEALYAKIA